jgi:hypothetical protein
MIVLVDRHNIANDHYELVAIDITDPHRLGDPVTLIDTPEYVTFGQRTPWGVHVVSTDNTSWETGQAQLDDMGIVQLHAALPEGLSGKITHIRFATDGSWALARVMVGTQDERIYRLDFAADGMPLAATEVHGINDNYHGQDDGLLDSGLVAFVVDDDFDDVYQLRLADIHPEVGASVVVDDILLPIPSPFGLHLDDNKLVYSKDVAQDGPNEWWVVDHTDLQAPPVLVTTSINGSDTIFVDWSPSGDRMIYWTGDVSWGQLYYVEFNGATPQAPVLISGEEPVYRLHFGFASEDRFWYIAGDENDDRHAIMMVDIDGDPTPAVQISEALDPGFQLLDPSSTADRSKVAYAATDGQQSWLSFLDLSVEVPAPLRVYDVAIGGTIFATVPASGQHMPFVAPTGPNQRHVFSVDLGDPELPVIQLDEALPVGWWQPMVVTLTPDDSQVLFRSGPTDAEDDVHMRVPVDGSAPIEPLHSLGFSLPIISFLTTQ